MNDTFVIRSQRVLTPSGLQPAAVHVSKGKIADVTAHGTVGHAALLDVGSHLLTPGIVDSHVHINEPGRTEWEGFSTATEAAAAGGITTVVDMPLNCIPATTTRPAAEKKLESLGDKLHVDVAFWGGVIPGNVAELEGLGRFGVPGCKCFLCPSGVDEFPHVERQHLDDAMPRLRDLGLTLLVHAEAPAPLEEAEQSLARAHADPRRYATYLASRPRKAEDDAIAMVIELARKHRTRTHIVHLSSHSALPLLEAARRDGVPITAETCLHYLTFTAEEIADGATHYKCAPPIRERENQAKLWEGLTHGTLSMVVSDHSPCTPALKVPETGDFARAWGGIASLQLGLSVLFTESKARGHSLEQMFSWNSTAPAALAGLSSRKGALRAGFDADFVVWDDAARFTVSPAEIRHRHKVTPYAGRTLWGVVHETWVRGRRVYSKAEGLATRPLGSFVAVQR